MSHTAPKRFSDALRRLKRIEKAIGHNAPDSYDATNTWQPWELEDGAEPRFDDDPLPKPATP